MTRGTGKTVKIPVKRERLDWTYDSEADVFYASIGKPRKAIGIDIGQGIVVRYDERKREVIGLTILGLRQRVTESLTT
jgi:uncharacterized protein YuzE